MNIKRIVVLLGFDMESDVRSWTTNYKGLKYGTPKILKILREYNVNATFFFTGEAAEASHGIVRLVRKNGHEIGCHTLYHETVGDEIFPIPFMNPIRKCEVKERLRAATDTIRRISGVRPVSFRSPRLFCSTEVITGLEELGYIVDASYPLYYFKEQLIPGKTGREIDAPVRRYFEKHGLSRYLVCSFVHTIGLHEAESPFFGPHSDDVLTPGMTVCIDVSFFGHPEFNGTRIETGYEITEKGPKPFSFYIEKEILRWTRK